jgi:hypothetical protein
VGAPSSKGRKGRTVAGRLVRQCSRCGTESGSTPDTDTDTAETLSHIHTSTHKANLCLKSHAAYAHTGYRLVLPSPHHATARVGARGAMCDVGPRTRPELWSRWNCAPDSTRHAPQQKYKQNDQIRSQTHKAQSENTSGVQRTPPATWTSTSTVSPILSWSSSASSGEKSKRAWSASERKREKEEERESEQD